MTRYPFAQVDAFADRAFTGNPAGVMLLDAWPDDALLQAMAQENNLPETAFLVPDLSAAADYELRWHTPKAEVALCGHATLASGHYLLARDPLRDAVRFRTRASGILTVARAAGRYDLTLPAWPATPRPLLAIAAALGVVPVDTLWHDSGYALIVLDDEAAVRAAAPDMVALHALGPVVAIISARGAATDIVGRVFTPAFDIPEDPVTGSAHAVAVPYWADVFGRDTMTAYQASARGGYLDCRLDGDNVILSGGCVTVIEGVFTLSDPD